MKKSQQRTRLECWSETWRKCQDEMMQTLQKLLNSKYLHHLKWLDSDYWNENWWERTWKQSYKVSNVICSSDSTWRLKCYKNSKTFECLDSTWVDCCCCWMSGFLQLSSCCAHKRSTFSSSSLSSIFFYIYFLWFCLSCCMRAHNPATEPSCRVHCTIGRCCLVSL